MDEEFHILIVDDEPNIRSGLRRDWKKKQVASKRPELSMKRSTNSTLAVSSS